MTEQEALDLEFEALIFAQETVKRNPLFRDPNALYAGLYNGFKSGFYTNLIKTKMKLKVFINELQATYGAGTLLVAARDKAEADAVAMNCKNLEFVYWDYDEDGYKYHYSFNSYPHDGWKEMQGVSYEGEPCVLHENHYYE